MLKKTMEQPTTSDETSNCKWIPKELALDWVALPSIRFRYQAYLDFSGSVNYISYVKGAGSALEVKLQRDI
ncbi:hypothetical protein ACFSGI_07925 [Paenibacillus nicotianae]|uniref:Uncharacterized protein n=1 Tax=Paenibacillus nicotianae TaxID=1526551 RepID=A0ABW4UQR7_9BACL